MTTAETRVFKLGGKGFWDRPNQGLVGPTYRGYHWPSTRRPLLSGTAMRHSAPEASPSSTGLGYLSLHTLRPRASRPFHSTFLTLPSDQQGPMDFRLYPFGHATVINAIIYNTCLAGRAMWHAGRPPRNWTIHNMRLLELWHKHSFF